MTRSGFVALAGRPNAGKSTLVNAIVADKVAIVSDKPQTTRREVRGIVTGDDWQLVLVDLPGVQRPRDTLTERMQRQVERALADADAALFVLNGEHTVGPGDRFIARAIERAGVATVTVVNKVDRLDRAGTVQALAAAAELELPGEVFPISARKGTGVPALVEHLVALLPEGPFLYPPEDHTDLPETVRLAELVREQVLRRTREELPHAVEVEVSEIERRDDGLLMVRAQVWAESESQKAILVGRGRPDDQGDRHRGAARDRALPRRAHAPGAPGARPARLAPRRGPARPARHRVTELERIRAFLDRERGGGLRRGPAGSLRHGAPDPEPAERVAAERPAGGGPGCDPARSWWTEAEELQADSATASCSCRTPSSARAWRPSWRGSAGT